MYTIADHDEAARALGATHVRHTVGVDSRDRPTGQAVLVHYFNAAGHEVAYFCPGLSGQLHTFTPAREWGTAALAAAPYIRRL